MCICMHSRFVENHSIWILEDGPLISEVILSQHRPSRPMREDAACVEGWAGTGGAGPFGPDPREHSNENLIFEFQMNLDFGKTLRISTRKVGKNCHMGIFPTFF
jgi:hypothetical protein